MDAKENLKLIEATLTNFSEGIWKLASQTAKFDQWSQMILLTSYLKHVSDMLDDFRYDLFPFVEE